MFLKNLLLESLWCFVLVQACQGELMCYVCDNCPVITADIPLLNCNEHYFNSDTTTRTTTIRTTSTETESTLLGNTDTSAGSSESMTTKLTTTTTLKPTEAMNSSFTTTAMETTTISATGKTTKTYPKTITPQADNSNSTEDINFNTVTTTPVTDIEEKSTENNLSESKTTKVYSRLSAPKFKSDFMSSQINETLIKHGEDETEDEITRSKIFKPSEQSRSRNARHTADQIYNCFKVEAKVNGSTNIARGCSRRTPPKTACAQWHEMHNNMKIDECYSCTSSECNGSSMVSVSVATLLIVLVAGCFHYH
uniref:Protein quiver n=1 Tax=Glossina palpalis gambiensis TaxID=67801 RepID=A0A1B0BG19_9MUSC